MVVQYVSGLANRKLIVVPISNPSNIVLVTVGSCLRRRVRDQRVSGIGFVCSKSGSDVSESPAKVFEVGRGQFNVQKLADDGLEIVERSDGSRWFGISRTVRASGDCKQHRRVNGLKRYLALVE